MNNKSNFVTVLAWIFIVGAGFTTLIAAMQSVMITVMFSGDEFKQVPDDAPGFSRFMFEYFHLFFYFFFALSLVTLVSSIGLLKRKNWARIFFIGIMSIGILWQIVGMVAQFFIFDDMPEMPKDAGMDQFQTMSNIMTVFMIVIGVGFIALFSWIIKKLVTQPIISEFIDVIPEQNIT